MELRLGRAAVYIERRRALIGAPVARLAGRLWAAAVRPSCVCSTSQKGENIKIRSTKSPEFGRERIREASGFVLSIYFFRNHKDYSSSPPQFPQLLGKSWAIGDHFLFFF